MRSKPDPFALTGAKTQNGAFQAGFTNILGGAFSEYIASLLCAFVVQIRREEKAEIRKAEG
jgi:hypothetical protein